MSVQLFLVGAVPLASLGPAVGLAVFAPAAAARAASLVGSGSGTVGSASGPGCTTGCGANFESVEELEAAFEQFGALSDESVASMARAQQAGSESGRSDPQFGIPLPGPAKIVECAIVAAWVFSRGVSRDTVVIKIAEVVVSCAGVPATSWVIRRVAQLVYQHRMKIVAALSATGLTAAQLAPLRNAKRP